MLEQVAAHPWAALAVSAYVIILAGALGAVVKDVSVGVCAGVACAVDALEASRARRAAAPPEAP